MQPRLSSVAASKPHIKPTNTYKQRQIITHPPLALVQTQSKTQQLHTFVTVAEPPGTVKTENTFCVYQCFAVVHRSFFFFSTLFPLSSYPPTSTATHLPAHPSTAATFEWQIQLHFLLACRSRGRKALHCLLSKRGKMAIVLLVEKDDGHYSSCKQMMCTESLTNLHINTKAKPESLPLHEII